MVKEHKKIIQIKFSCPLVFSSSGLVDVKHFYSCTSTNTLYIKDISLSQALSCNTFDALCVPNKNSKCMQNNKNKSIKLLLCVGNRYHSGNGLSKGKQCIVLN